MAVVLNGKRTELHKLSLHRSLPRDHSKEGKAKTLVKRSLTFVFLFSQRKVPSVRLLGGRRLKILEFVNANRLFINGLFAPYVLQGFIAFIAVTVFPLVGLDQ